MDADVYQRLAMRTAASITNFKDGVVTAALGLTGESGEVADSIKKWVAQGHELNRAKLLEETSDVLWYCALMCHVLDASLSEVMQLNIDKLKARYPQGFSTNLSVNRNE